MMPEKMSLILKLRDITGHGLQDCKSAIEFADGDLEQARLVLALGFVSSLLLKVKELEGKIDELSRQVSRCLSEHARY